MRPGVNPTKLCFPRFSVLLLTLFVCIIRISKNAFTTKWSNLICRNKGNINAEVVTRVASSLEAKGLPR